MSQGMKTCTKCGLVAPATREFFHLKGQGDLLKERCKNCENKRKRDYRSANQEHVRALDRALYAKTPYPDRERNQRYNTQKPEKAAARRRRRRALALNNGLSIYQDSDVLAAYGFDCHLCGKPIDLQAPRRAGIEGWELGLHIDHLVPLSAGGPDTLENVRPSHGRCNVAKGART